MSILPMVLVLLAQAAEPARERVVLTGTVVGPDGKPAVGMEVVLADDASSLIPYNRLAVAVPRPPAVLETRRADADGRFRFELPERGEVRQDPWRRPGFLWAIGPRGAPAMRPIPDDWPPDGIPIRLALAPPGPVEFLVLDPDERPVAEARLAPAWIRGMNLPDDLGDRLAARTDGRGRATLEVGAIDEVEVVRVVSGPFGVQQLRMPRPDAAGVRTLRLMPVGRIAGRIEAGDPRAVRGLAVRVRTDPDPAGDVGKLGGFASAVTDDQGRFTIPQIAAGTLAVSVEYRWELPWRGQRPDRMPVRPGTTTEVAIPLQRAGLVKGIVLEAPSGRPLAGVGVGLTVDFDQPLARTDAEGRFAAYVAPGVLFANPVDLPRGFCRISPTISRLLLPEGTAELNVEPLGLRRAVELRGRVLDAEGKPVPVAGVAGHVELVNGFLGSNINSVTDRQGRFRITGLAPDATAYLSAARGEATTAAPMLVLASKGTIDLTIKPENAIALVGRVKDPAGRPVVGATVRVSARKRSLDGIPVEQIAATFDDEGRTTVHTGADGQFRTPRRLRPDLEYRVDVEADGYTPADTGWTQPGDRKLWYLAAVTLRPSATTRTVAGRVVDAAGRPIAGAVVFQSGDGPALTRTTTGPDGRFRLPGVHNEPAFLFVEADGLAFEGHRIGAGDDPVELKVRRVGEPAAGPPLRTLPPVLPREEEKALARRMIGTDLTALNGQAPREAYPLIRVLPRVDFDRAMDLAENPPATGSVYGEEFRWECAIDLSTTSLDEAATVAETLESGRLRSLFYCWSSDALPKADRAHKLDLLDKALFHARAETAPAARLRSLGLVGYRLLDLGETARGTAVLREGQHLADTLKDAAGQRTTPFARLRGEFAAKLARIDARAALELAEGAGERSHDEYRSGVALALADRDPAGSERVFGTIKDRRLRDAKVVRAAGRMAAVDRERARRLLETLEQPRDQALALGAMAHALAEIDKKAASAILDEAFRRLEKLAHEGGERYKAWACVTAGHLLPTAEAIDPELLRRAFWRTLALRPPRPAGGDPRGAYEESIADLAIVLARYDRAVARQLLEPVAARVRSLVERSRAFQGHDLFAAAALIDPSWAVALADALPDDTPGARLHAKAAVRRVIATILAYHGPERWFYLDMDYLQLPDDSRDNEN